MKVGEISQPFKTDYGYHIVKLNQYNEPRNVSLEKDWEQIKSMALNFKIETEYKDWILSMKKDIPIEYKISFDWTFWLLSKFLYIPINYNFISYHNAAMLQIKK